MNKLSLRYLKPQAVIIICVILGISLYLTNNYLNSHWGLSVSIFAIISGVFVLINKYLWNIRPFSWMFELTDFSGRYEGTLKFEFRNENCEIVRGTLKHTKIIKQNGSDVIVHSWTKKPDGSISSKSTSIDASIIKEKDGNYTLIYNYLNDGNFELDFCPHYGTEVLHLIKDEEGKHLIGKYYTERLPFQTKGKIELQFFNNNSKHLK